MKSTDAAYIASTYFDDPVGYVRDVIGAEPDEWQIEALESLIDNKRLAVSSGHGVGKSATTSFMVKWFIATRPNPQIVVTANTKNQLDTKTWRELSKWNSKSLDKDIWIWSKTRFALSGEEDTWFASAIPQSEHNAEAFAGTHEEYVLGLFDEASSIPKAIWDAFEGAMTTDGARWAVFGNPTRSSGPFYDCFHNMKHRWYTMKVDSRTAKMASASQIQEWLDDYGEDSDFFRVRVRGEFPRTATSQFMSEADVTAAMSRTIQDIMNQYHTKVMAVDVARFGDDSSVIFKRQGAVTQEPRTFKGIDTMELANRVAEEAYAYQPAAIFVDANGVGAGVADRLKQMGLNVVDVMVGSNATRPNEYANLRAELYGRLRDWLKNNDPQLPRNDDLRDQLLAIEYGFDSKNRIQLEKKSDMKKRGLPSPDEADALAMTFMDFQFMKQLSPRRHVRRYANTKGWAA